MKTLGEIREQLHELRVIGAMKRCVYFTTFGRARCLAGVKYVDLLGANPDLLSSTPCASVEGGQITPCPWSAYRTREQAEAYESALEARVQECIANGRQG